MKHIPIIILSVFITAFAGEPEIYYLDNGMEIVLIENHASPVIASSIVIRAGLRDETPEIIGASHFLEHLLFNGTKSRTQEQLYEEMDMLGGYNNAHTGENFTNFVILSNRDNFEQALDIQSDMIFNSTLPTAKFEKEKGIVIEEIGQSYDRASYEADIQFCNRFFRGTPYAYQILGTKQSIQNMRRQDILEYYHTHYIPNNMTAIITGDFEKPEIKKVVEKYLGATAPGTLPERPYYRLRAEYQESGIADVYYHYKEGNSVLLRVGVLAPDRMQDDFYAAEILRYILSKRLEDSIAGETNRLANSFNVEYFSDRDFGAFILKAQLTTTKSIEPAIQAFRNAFLDVSRNVPSTTELQNYIISEKSQSLLYSERPHFWSMMKSYLMGFHGYEFIRNYYQNLQKVKPENIGNLAKSIYNTATFIPTVMLPYPEVEEGDSQVAQKHFNSKTLDNGLRIIAASGSGSGIFAAHFLFKGRSMQEPAEKTGITNLLHNMLLKGTKALTAEELEGQMNALGMKIEVTDNPWIPFDDYRTSPKFSYIRMEVPAENWKQALKLTADIILNPAFNPATLEQTRGMLIGTIARSSKSAADKSKQMFLNEMLGDHTLSKNPKGNVMSLKAIKLEDIEHHYQKYFTAKNLIITIVGDVPIDEAVNNTAKLFSKMPAGTPFEFKSHIPKGKTGEFRETLGKKQSYIRIGYIIPNIPEEDEAGLIVANWLMNDNMSFELREVQGLAYTMSSSINIEQGWGYLMISMGTSPENITKAIEGIKRELAQAAKGEYTDKEVTKAQNSYRGRLNMRLLTSINRAYYMGIHTMQGEPPDAQFKKLDRINGITAEEVNRCAKKYFNQDDLLIVVVE